MSSTTNNVSTGDVVSFRWPKDDNKTWIEYIGLATAERKFIHGNKHVAVIRNDGVWFVPCSWCSTVSDIQMCG